MTEEIKFVNENSGELLIHRDRDDGKRDLFVTTPGSSNHSHAVINLNGTPSFIRESDGHIVCDDRK